jgi:hypothetical protein
MKATIVVLTLLSLSIWLYLLYSILTIVKATELMWFLYYIYVPTSITVTTLIQAIKNEHK